MLSGNGSVIVTRQSNSSSASASIDWAPLVACHYVCLSTGITTRVVTRSSLSNAQHGSALYTYILLHDALPSDVMALHAADTTLG